MQKIKTNHIFQMLCSRIIFGLTGVVLFFSCKEDNDLKMMSLAVQLQFPEEAMQVDKEGIALTILNQNKEIKWTSQTDENGVAIFDTLEPGMYMAQTSTKRKVNGRFRILNGNQTFEVNSSCQKNLELKMAKIGKFVISQYYYSGCYTKAGKPFNRDQFIEIYNNSEDILYADGMSIVEHEADGNIESEWQKEEPTHMVVKIVWTIPGNGSDVPVYPGKSLIIASHAFNYKTDSSGITTSPVDLGNADFEFYIPHEVKKNENPDVPNMELSFIGRFTTSQYSFGTNGGSAMALAWLPENKKEYIQSNRLGPYKSSIGLIYFATIPNEFVEDAVETVRSDKVFKRLDASLDAGYVSNEKSFSALAIRRKVDSVYVDGRKMLKDTNNSTEDFDHDVVPVPRFFDMN